MPEDRLEYNLARNRKLLWMCFGAFIGIATVLLLWPRTSSTNSCGAGCTSIPEDTTTTVTERGLPYVWSRSFVVTDIGGQAAERSSHIDQAKLALDISLLMMPLVIMGVLMRVVEQNAHNRH